MAGASNPCIFCQIARSSSTPTDGTTPILYSDDRVVAFPDINPAAFRHYLVIPVQHIPTTEDLQSTTDDYQLVKHMLHIGRTLMDKDAPSSKKHRFGFHRPPYYSVDHLHLHCLALPFIPRWKEVKYMPLGPFVGFVEADELLKRIKPPTVSSS